MGPDPDNLPIAFAVGVRECRSLGAKELTIITPVSNNLDSIVVGEFLGQDASKRLMKGEKVPMGETGVRLTHKSTRTIGQATKVGLAFYVSNDAIRKLDDLDFGCLIYIPWADQDGEQWAKKWDAEPHSGKTTGADIALPPALVDSLTSLTHCVNLSTGLGHPSDKNHAKRCFSEAKASGLTWDPSEVEKWAVRNGWNAEFAKELSEFSSRYT